MKKAFNLATLTVVTIFIFSITGLGHTQSTEEGNRKSQGYQGKVEATQPSLEQIQQGKALYEGLARCVHCHGQKALRRLLSYQELFSIIKFGVPGTSHIPFQRLLSDEEIWSIVYFQLSDHCMNDCEN